MAQPTWLFAALATHLPCLARTHQGVIDEEEFHQAIPAHVRAKHSPEEISSWFQMLDNNGNGSISRDEHLRWSLNAAALQSGASIKNVFERYDRDNNGTLSELECTHARGL